MTESIFQEGTYYTYICVWGTMSHSNNHYKGYHLKRSNIKLRECIPRKTRQDEEKRRGLLKKMCTICKHFTNTCIALVYSRGFHHMSPPRKPIPMASKNTFPHLKIHSLDEGVNFWSTACSGSLKKLTSKTCQKPRYSLSFEYSSQKLSHWFAAGSMS